MGFLKNLLIIVLILVALAYLFPAEYDQGKQWMVDQAVYRVDNFLDSRMESTLNESGTNIAFEYVETEFGKDYGKILGRLNCTTDVDCIDYFQIQNLTCSINGTCIEEVNQNE